MNNTIIAIIVGLLVVAGGAYFFFMSPGGGELNTGDQEAAVGESTSGNTFAAALAAGQDLECTFTHNDGANSVSGTAYIANGGERFAGDFTMQQGGAEPMEGHVIRTGGYNYVWGSFYPQGIKSKVTAENEDKLFDSKDTSVGDDTEFNCKSWRVDSSKFRVPGNVEFMDISTEMEAMIDASAGVGNVSAQQCAACQQLPAGAKEQCLAALSC